MRLAGIWRIKEIEISDLEINGQTSLYKKKITKVRNDKDKDQVSKYSTNIIRYAMHVHSEKILDAC